MAERALATAFVNLVPGTVDIDKYLKQKLGDEVGQAADNAGRKFGKRLSGGFKSSMGGLQQTLASGLGAAAVGNWLKGSMDSLQQEQAGQAQTAAAIKSTGGAAKVTAKHVEALAQALETKNATDADAIRQGSNMLLTFTNIKNGVGASNQIFDQATQTAIDMSRALGQDVSQSAMQLGKALNDPEKGVTALRRVGVQLSADQEKQVKHFMKVGDAASAQKVILGELAKEFGGSGAAYADTYAGKMFKLSDAMDDMGKKVMETLMPSLSKLADIGIQFFDWISAHPEVQALIGAIAAAFVILNAAVAISNILMALNPFVIIAIAAVALIGAIIWLATKTTFFQDLWKNMTAMITKAWDAVVGFFKTTFNNVAKWFGDIWRKAGAAWNSFVGWIQGAANAIGDVFNKVWQGITNFFKGYVNGWLAIAEGFINFFIDGINNLIKTANAGLGFLGKLVGQKMTIGLIGHVSLPRLAKGGFVDQPTTALIGEAGPEVVTPLKDFERMMGLGDGKQSSRPIHADGIGLLGWLREEANGQARLVFNTEMSKVMRGAR